MAKIKWTKEEFEGGYCQRSGITIEEYRRNHITMLCSCGEPGCDGWARILNDPDAIEHQRVFCTPGEA